MQQRSGNTPFALGLLVLAGVFVLISLFYFTTRTSLLASSDAKHYKHAILALVLAVLCVIGANFARRPQA